ncbi:MAG: PQQ-binding-like beta-propeller repeat protein [Burkholderiales bacterium]|nr:PQQ-binding-like beta-propeller repeat protein [Burkholderiales bacterium]
MKHTKKYALPALLLCAASALAPTQTAAEDIDIFTGAGGGSGADPKILIILDNTSNWSRQSQQWPGGLAQGQSEARAINTVLGAIGSDVNMGLMEFVTGGNANDTGGYIRRAIKPMTDANKTAFSTELTAIYNNIGDPDEKRNANTEYGNLMRDAYNYFSGGNSVSPSAVVASKADSDGYTTNYTTFKSPLSDANSCGRNFIIFIGNPNNNGPAADTAANSTALTSAPLSCSVSPQIKVPAFTTGTTTTSTNLGYTSQCYASLAACSTSDYSAQAGSYDTLSCSNSLTTTNRDTCAGGTQRYSVTGNTITSSGSTTAPAVITAPTNTSVTTSCYTSAAAAAGDHGGMSLPSQSVVTTGTAPNLTTTTTTYSNDTYVIGAVDAAASASCTASVGAAVLGSNQITNTSALSTSCYTGTNTGSNKWNNSTDYGTLTCPATTVVTSGNDTTTTTYTCSYSGVISADTTGCSGSQKHVTVTQAATGSPSTVTTAPRYKYAVTQTVTASAVAVTTTGSVSTPTLLGDTTQCYANTTSIPEFSATCSGYNGGCTYGTPSASAGLCASGARYSVFGNSTGTTVTPTGSFITPSTAANADEWASCLHKAKSINPASSPADTIKQTITTYTIDVFNAQQNAEETQLYMSMARVGGGKYFAATNEAAIVNALKSILNEIQSVNTTFASASLPVNATNRTQNANQVFIGMFRPDPDANPRWFGNLKQYAIGKVGGDLDLVDKNGAAATNALTGFIDDCAASFWTTDSSNYWSNIVVNPDPASTCTSAVASNTVYSDLPDGPTVEKGAVAEILRRGNTPGGATTQTTANRTMLTLSGSSLVDFNTTNVPSGTLAANIVDFTLGKDVNNATGLYDATTNPTQTRPSIHGDVVHSRPLPVNYGGTAGVTVYYGANDGTLRAVDASNGKERWAFVAPTHFPKLQRLKDNTPPVDYKLGTVGATAKDYFFDGSIGIYQAAAGGTNPPVWIYPTQRRGGRMIYAFDVSDPTASPTLKWKHGCDSAGVCDTGFSQMGQTWSTPNVAFINGYSPDKTTNPVVVMGGGYDSCEDDDNLITTQCASTKGNVVYFMDANIGTLIASFATTRAVAADVNMIDINNDGLVDYAYVADVGGNIYRIDFVMSPTTLTPRYPSSGNLWSMHKVAYTNSIGQGRKFLFGPGLFPSGTSNFLAIVSGDREHPLISNYPYTVLPYPNRAYVFKDDLTSTSATAATDLDLDPDMLDVTNTNTSTCTSTNLLTDSSKKGWYMYLNQYGQGEQGVTSAVIVGGMVTFSTNRPLSSALSCNTRLGEARGYFVNLFNGSGSIGTANNASCGGSRSVTFAGGGLPPSPVIGIVPIDGQPTAVLIGAPPRDGGGASPIKPTKINPPIAQVRTRTYKYIKGDN